MERQENGICYECSTKDGDSSEKRVYHCDDCKKWFCGLHRKPRFPYFVDWETEFDVRGDPAVKALFFSEYRRIDGHPDFIYLRKTVEGLEFEEKKNASLIKQAIDKMMQNQLVEEAKPFDVIENRKRTVERFGRQDLRDSIILSFLLFIIGSSFLFLGIWQNAWGIAFFIGILAFIFGILSLAFGIRSWRTLKKQLKRSLQTHN